MKFYISCLFVSFVCLSCKNEVRLSSENEKNQIVQKEDTTIAKIEHSTFEDAVIYEANIRQYSEEGTFHEFTKDIPKLKKLGIKILWLMPVYPISTTKSKGSLGSYYAVSDYKKVNPEFGSEEDLKNLIKSAHQNGIYVILDWVANHTGWDHIWLKEHPEYYTKNEKGEIIHTEGTDWTDVADLDYNNMEMRKEMRESMKYWVENFNIDGFRCDVAGMVPVDFWEETVNQLNTVKPVFMLAEGWEPELLENAFDMGYSWDTHHVMNAIAQGEKTVKAWDSRMVQIDTLYQKDDILMNFTSNHDENSWNGTVKERLGEAAELFAVLTYIAPGMPLIYSGQEYDMDKRLLFFEKDTIIKKKRNFFPLYKKLGNLKIENSALDTGPEAASYQRIATSNDDKVLAIMRKKGNDQIVFVANMTDKPLRFSLADDSFEGINYFTNKKIHLKKGEALNLQPWDYLLLVN